MLFNSIDFVIFLPIVFCLYWFIANRTLKFQNLLLVSASLFFYGWWDWRFLILMVLSAVVDYFVGIGFLNTENQLKRKLLLSVSVCVNLGALGIFKYYNFFIHNFAAAFSFLGYHPDFHSLYIILPMGISFYTFKALSYSIDAYRKQLVPNKDFVAYFAFLSFFPQLVAGPIERAIHFLPQFNFKRQFDYSRAVDGLKQILWGFLKKLVIADNCAEYADLIFNNSAAYNGSTLVLGAVFFAFQIYGDFSGYSDISIGISRLFGFDVRKNFAVPYFSRDIAEFWRRWHISLSTWFRDYVYMPLGGSFGGVWRQVRNILIVFIVSGLWHGANWTFIFWGILNAIYILPLLLLNTTSRGIVAKGKHLPTLRETMGIAITFSLTLFAWIFFRAADLHQAFVYISGIFSLSLFDIPQLPKKALVIVWLIGIFITAEWFGRGKPYAIQGLGQNIPRLPRWALYSFVIFMVSMYMNTGGTPFIYFKF